MCYCLRCQARALPVRFGKQRRNPLPNQERTLNITALINTLGISKSTLRRYVILGLPNTKIGRNRYFNLEEVKNWIHQRVKAIPRSSFGYSVFPEVVVSSSDVSKALQQTKKALGLTINELAQELELTVDQLQAYLYPSKDRKTSPAHLITDAESLMFDLIPKRHRLSKPTREQVLQAMTQASGMKNIAAKLLKVHVKRLNDLILEYDIDTFLPIAERLTQKQIEKALETNKGNKIKAAQQLGITDSSLHKLIRGTNLQRKYHRKIITKQDLIDALQQSGGRRDVAAKLLHVTPKAIGEAMRRFEIKSLFPVTRASLTQESVFQALRQTEGNITHAAKLLGVSKRGLQKFMKRIEERIE